MPLMKYVGFVGSALVVLLVAMNWVLPEPAAEPVLGTLKKPVIKISSIEKLPERVVFDTSMLIALPPSVMPGAVQPLQSTFTFAQMTPSSLPAFVPLAEVSPKKLPNATKRFPEKKAATHRFLPQAHTAAVKNYPVREAALSEKPPAKATFLDELAERFGQVFRLN